VSETTPGVITVGELYINKFLKNISFVLKNVKD